MQHSRSWIRSPCRLRFHDEKYVFSNLTFYQFLTSLPTDVSRFSIFDIIFVRLLAFFSTCLQMLLLSSVPW